MTDHELAFGLADRIDGAMDTLGGVTEALDRVRAGCLYLPKALQHDLEVLAQGIGHATKELGEARGLVNVEGK